MSSSSLDNRLIISSSRLNPDKDAQYTMLFMKIHMVKVVDVVEGEGEGEAEVRVGAVVAMEHIKIMEGIRTGVEVVDEAEAGDITMVGTKVVVVGAEDIVVGLVVVGE